MLTRSRSLSTDSSQAADSQSSSSQQLSSQEDSAPQVDYVSKKKKRGRGRPTQLSQWVCIMPEQLTSIDSTPEEQSFISLKDPKTGCERRYLLRRSGDRHELCEVLRFLDEPRSWFIGNTVQTDGGLYMCTSIDPLFLALSCLLQHSTDKARKFTTLDAILEDPNYHGYRCLERCVESEQWEHVCDTKSLPNDTMVYRYNQEKTLNWLRQKVAVLASQLREEKVYVGAGSQSSILKRSNKKNDASQEDYLHYACGLVCDYISKEIGDKLTQYFPPVTNASTKVRKLEKCDDGGAEMNGPVEPPAKRLHLDQQQVKTGEPLDDYSKLNTVSAVAKAAPQKMSATQKALAKVDKTGMKSIASFFTAKPKKQSK